MIYISTTQSHPIYTTAKQNKIDLTTNFYTWRIEERSNNFTFTIAPDDWSDSPYYCAFTMSDRFASNPPLPTSETGSVAVVFRQGEMHYEIHQTSVQYDLGLTSSLGIVEKGILISRGDATFTQSFFTASNNNTIRVFRSY